MNLIEGIGLCPNCACALIVRATISGSDGGPQCILQIPSLHNTFICVVVHVVHAIEYYMHTYHHWMASTANLMNI